MNKVSIAIEKRVSMSTVDLALRAALNNELTDDYVRELAAVECSGANRMKKVAALLRRLVVRNPLLPTLVEQKDAVISMLDSNVDRPLLFAALMSSSYSIFYDTLRIAGKYFHAQNDITRPLMLTKLSDKYGSNRSLDVAYDCIMPMLLDAGLIHRKSQAVYNIVKQPRASKCVIKIYRQSFLLNNPVLDDNDNIDNDPYFEYLT